MKIDPFGMDWSTLPLEPLESILRGLSFRERLSSSLVCHRWNEALFGCPSLAHRIVLRMDPASSREVLGGAQLSGRNYRQLSVLLTAQNFVEMNECLRAASEKWNIRFVALVGEASQLLGSFRLNEVLFGGLTELSLELTANDSRGVGTYEVTLGVLKKFHYLQMYSGCAENQEPLFRLVAPKLEFVSVVLDSLANEEVQYWEDALVELVDCSQLKQLEVDLNHTMWEGFFREERPHLERLVIRRASDEFMNRDWEQIFAKMPNIRQVELVFSNDYILTSMSRHCRNIKHLQLTGFSFHQGTFSSTMNWSTLQHLSMDGWVNGGLFSTDKLLELPNLLELSWKYVELTPVQVCFMLETPRLRRLTLRGCDFKTFQLSTGPHVEFLDMDYHNKQTCAPNFFSSLRNLRQLILHINGRSLKLVHQLTYMPHLTQVEIICSTEKRGYDFNALFSTICANSPNLEELLIRNEHENRLSLDYDSLLHLTRLKRLKTLSLHYITILNVVSQELRMECLMKLTVGGCAVLGADGTRLVQFPIVSDAKEDSQWSVNEPLVV